MRGTFGGLRELLGGRRGSISVLSAFVLVGVVGVSALALEYGHGLLERSENQRVADLAAYGGALVYNSTSSSADATGAANNIVALNGLSGDATPTVVSSPTGDGNQAMQVTVTTQVPLLLARVLTTQATMPISATAYAEMKANAPGCVIALSGSGSGVALSGTGSITADDCAVVSNSTVCADSGANPSDVITTKTLDYDSGSSPSSSKCTISPPSGTPSVHINKTSTSDPLSGNSEITGAVVHLATVASQPAPTVPAGTSVKFGYSQVTTLPTGCLDTYSSGTHSVNCTGNTAFNFGGITLQGGVTVSFIATGITYNIGTSTCNGTAGYSICNTGTSLTFGGPSTFVLAGGIYNGGGASLSLGGGDGNSYRIGAAADGNSINAGTSQTTNFVAATSSGDLFQTAGNIVSGGGTCLSLPAAAEHDIHGNISLSGGTTLGAGIYTVTGYVAFGANNGGAVTCSGKSVGVDGSSGVTFVIGGATTVSCGSSNQAFCLGAGFDPVILTAPTSGNTADLVMIGPPATSANPAAGAWFGQGASNSTFSGAVYFPNGPINMSGSATLGGTGPCLELIGSQVTLSAGTAVGSTCAGLGSGSTGATVALVQ